MADGDNVKINIKTALDSAGVDASKKKLDDLTGAADRATKGTERLSQATNKSTRANDNAAKSVNGISASFAKMKNVGVSAFSKLKDASKSLIGNLANIQAGFQMVYGSIMRVVGMMAGPVMTAFRFEKIEANFRSLLGNAEKAKQHIKDLRTMGAATPLTFDDLSQASKLLHAFGSKTDEVMPSLKMLGDIALGDAQRFQGLALVFAQVKSQGKLMGQDLMQFVNQGFNPLKEIADQTGRSMADLKDMMSKGEISFDMVAEAMKRATDAGGKFNNAMMNSATTGEGLMSTLSDNWTEAVATFGNELMDVAKGGLQWCISKIKELTESGKIVEWAQKARDAVYSVVGAFQGLSDASTRANAWEAVKDVVIGGFEEAAQTATNVLMKTAPIIGGLIGQGFVGLKDIMGDMMSESAARSAAKEQIMDKFSHVEERAGNPFIGSGKIKFRVLNEGVKKEDVDEAMSEANVDDLTQKILKDMRQQKALEMKIKAEEMASGYVGGGEEKKGESRFERGIRVLKELGEKTTKNILDEIGAFESTSGGGGEQKRLDLSKELENSKSAERIAREREKAEAKRIAQEEKARLEMERKVARERERLFNESVKREQQTLRKAEKEKSEAKGDAADADRKLSRAWGWYRDKDSLKLQLEEEKAEAKAQKQFDKDLDSLKRRKGYDWRNAKNLSIDDEAVRRVAVAREEKAKAEKNLEQIEKNTAELAKKLDDLLTIKG